MRKVATAVTVLGTLGFAVPASALLIRGTFGAATIIGTRRPDTIHAHHGDDEVYGLAGNDRLFGQSGDDTVYGNTGDDYIEGGDGANTLYGKSGSDTLTIGGSPVVARLHRPDEVIGGHGHAANIAAILERERSRADNRAVLGGDAYGGPGNDVIYGGPEADVIYGGDGNDTIYARDGVFGNDEISCGAGVDTVYVDKAKDPGDAEFPPEMEVSGGHCEAVIPG
jgi:Ca2+-binding RTX toxin-like protein